MDVRRQRQHIRNKLRNLQAWVEIANSSKGKAQFWDNFDTVDQILGESIDLLKDYQQSIENGYIDPSKARI